MPSKALFAKSARLTTIDDALPTRIGDLNGCELTVHCEGCGRHVQLYPGHAAFHSRMKLASLLQRLACTARRNGRACGGLPRRLTLVRDEQHRVLDADGEWRADDSVFWEPSDFEARAGNRAGH